MCFLGLSGTASVVLALNSRKFLRMSTTAQALWATATWAIHSTLFIYIAVNA
jgi:hypothetical protein